MNRKAQSAAAAATLATTSRNGPPRRLVKKNLQISIYRTQSIVRSMIAKVDFSGFSLPSSPYKQLWSFFAKHNFHFAFNWHNYHPKIMRNWDPADYAYASRRFACRIDHLGDLFEHADKRLKESNPDQVKLWTFLATYYWRRWNALRNVQELWDVWGGSCFIFFLVKGAIAANVHHPRLPDEKQKAHEIDQASYELRESLFDLERTYTISSLRPFARRFYLHQKQILQTMHMYRQAISKLGNRMKEVRHKGKTYNDGRGFRFQTPARKLHVAQSLSRENFEMQHDLTTQFVGLIEEEPRLWPAFSIFDQLRIMVLQLNRHLLQVSNTADDFNNMDETGGIPQWSRKSRLVLFGKLKRRLAAVTILNLELEELCQHAYALSCFKVTETTCEVPVALIERSRRFVFANIERDMKERQQRAYWYTAEIKLWELLQRKPHYWEILRLYEKLQRSSKMYPKQPARWKPRATSKQQDAHKKCKRHQAQRKKALNAKCRESSAVVSDDVFNILRAAGY